MPGYHHSTSVVPDKRWQPSNWGASLGGLLIRTCGEASMARGHLHYKFWECEDCLTVSVWARWLFANLKTLWGSLRHLVSAVFKATLRLAVVVNLAMAPERQQPTYQSWHLCSLTMCSSNSGLLLLCGQLEISTWLDTDSPECLLI